MPAVFSAVHASGVRAPLIGRRVLVLQGLPLLTTDYDYWIAIDDLERFNARPKDLEDVRLLHPQEVATMIPQAVEAAVSSVVGPCAAEVDGRPVMQLSGNDRGTILVATVADWQVA